MGGFAGHMMHPYDNMDNTLEDLINIVKIFDQDEEIKLNEKLDGLNIFVSFKNDKLTMARNKSDIKSGGFSYDDIFIRWKDNRNVMEAYQYAYIKLSNILHTYYDLDTLNLFFNKENYQIWFNCEVIHYKTLNVIPYANDFVSIHSTHGFDNNANEIEITKDEKLFIHCMFDTDTMKNHDATVMLTDNNKVSYLWPKTKQREKYIDYIITDLKYIFNDCKLTEKNTIREFLKASLIKITDFYAHVFSDPIYIDIYKLINTHDNAFNQIIINRLLFNDKSTNLKEIKDIIKNDDNMDNSLIDILNNITDKKMTEIKNQLLKSIIDIFRTLGDNVMNYCKQYNNSDDEYVIINEIYNRFNEMGFYETNYALIEPKPLEGIVFDYNGNTYKLTGYFPLFNNFLRENKS